MRLSLRFLIPLALALGAIAYNVVPLVDELTLKWFVRDLDIRKSLIASAVQEPLVELLTDNARDRVRLQRVQALLTRILQDERLFALGFCDGAGKLVYRTPTLPPEVTCRALGRPGGGNGARPEAGKGRAARRRHAGGGRGPAARRAADRARHELHRAAQRGHQEVHHLPVRRHRRGHRAHHGGDRGTVVPRLDGRHQGAHPRPVARPVAGAEIARAAADRARPGGDGARTRGRAPDARRVADQLDAGEPARHPARGPEGRRDPDRLQPRTLHPRAQGRARRGAASGKRAGDGDGARHARLLGHLDRARLGQRRPRGGGRARPRHGAAREARLPHPAGLADEGGGSRLLLRLRQRGAVAAVPHRAYAAGIPRRRTGSTTGPSTSASRRPWCRSRAPRIRSCWCRTTTSRCCPR